MISNLIFKTMNQSCLGLTRLRQLRIIQCFCSMLVACLNAEAACLGDKSAPLTYSVYIVPQLTSTQIYASWAPLLQEIGIASRQCFELVITPTIPDFEIALLSGKPDFAFMNPYHLVMAHNAQGYVPLIADGSVKLDGFIVVRTDSPITSLQDLNAMRIAFPSPNAFAASLLIRAILAKEKIDIQTVYVKSHSNVYRSVILGDVQAGGGVNYTLSREPIEVQSMLRILYTSQGYMGHPFAANPRIPIRTRTLISNSFLNLKKNNEGKKMLDAAQIVAPVLVDYERDYARLEQLGLEDFVVPSSR